MMGTVKTYDFQLQVPVRSCKSSEERRVSISMFRTIGDFWQPQATPIVNGDRRPSEKNGLTFNPKKRRSEGLAKEGHDGMMPQQLSSRDSLLDVTRCY